MKSLFLYPKWTGAYKGITAYFAKKSGGTYPPLNLAFLAALTESAGHEAEIIDGEVLKMSTEDLVDTAINAKPDVVALTGMTPFFHLSVEVAKKLRDKGFKEKIIIGGQHVTILEEKAVGPMFDYGFVGEAEEGWPGFLDAVEGKRNFCDVPGLIYREGGEFRKNKRKSCDKNLDIYPWAARHLLPMEKYRLGTLRGSLPFTTIQTYRGCPFKCIFCASEELMTTRISKRSTNSIIREIKSVIDRWDIRHFMIVDDTLTLAKKRTLELCDAIINEKLSITWEGSTRANLVDEELVVKMKEAGLIRLGFGLETINEEMRKTMLKKVPLDCYRETNALCNKYGIEATNSVMIGLPGETRETVDETFNFLKNAKEVKQANLTIATPYPGTEFYDMAVNNQHGIELTIDDWSQYKRYGQAVINIGELSQKDLVRIQNEGFVSIYSAYWRWWPVYKKNGIIGLVLTFYRYMKFLCYRLLDIVEESKRHPALD